MNKPRRCYEVGHRPKFMAVVDETPECAQAVRFAARRAQRIGGGVLLLSVARKPDAEGWLAVGDVMTAEALGHAETLLDGAASQVRGLTGLEPERVARVGAVADEIIGLVGEDEDIAVLVLAASAGRDGPGPLVSSLAAKMPADFPIPLAIVPGHLSETDLDALA
jgi:nucleotide-binding universal stress UspA family protein